MEIVNMVVASEFFWGILIGATLTVAGAYITDHLQNRRREKIVRRFCHDAATNLCEHIQSMDDHRDRARQIHHEFIALIEAELEVVMRNKEHMVQIDDEVLRRNVRDFFNSAAITLAVAKNNLARFYDADRIAQSSGDEHTRQLAANEASLALAEAHRACDKLAALRNESRDLRNALG